MKAQVNFDSLGGGVVSLVFNPQKNNNTGFLAFDTSKIKHFKGAWDSMSTYADDSSKFVVGYTDSLNLTSMSLINSQGINGADFNVDTTYKYLVCLCNDGSYWGRVYDIELTL